MAKRVGNHLAVYNASGVTLTDGDETGLFVDSNGALLVNATFTTGDIEIGAVELKDGTTDARVTAKVDNAAAGTPTPLSTGGKYNATPPTYDDGDQVTNQYDVNGNHKVTIATLLAGEDLTNNTQGVSEKPVASSTYSWLIFNQILDDVDISVKSSAGNLGSVMVSNINAAIRYLQIHNKATAPANPNVPVLSFPIPAGSATAPGYLFLGAEELGRGGLNLATGIAIGVSTTAATFTAATTTDHVVAGRYV